MKYVLMEFITTNIIPVRRNNEFIGKDIEFINEIYRDISGIIRSPGLIKKILQKLFPGLDKIPKVKYDLVSLEPNSINPSINENIKVYGYAIQPALYDTEISKLRGPIGRDFSGNVNNILIGLVIINEYLYLLIGTSDIAKEALNEIGIDIKKIDINKEPLKQLADNIKNTDNNIQEIILTRASEQSQQFDLYRINYVPKNNNPTSLEQAK